MLILTKISNRIVTSLAALIILSGVYLAPVQVRAQTSILDELFVELQNPETKDWEATEKKIWKEWGKSGSAAMDLLMQRGRDAMERGDVHAAIGHFSALIDHAPDFAEGWNARATAFFVADRYGLSIADIRQTLALNPRHFGALSGLGMILERMDQPQKALKAYRQVLDIHPHRPDVIEAINRLEAVVEGTEL
ncbi:MAG: tetratricopeptide repeat protein [Rhodobacteraceae bacterium]|nr:tetratricopeptide repeat protein [Paracoccaceae bacterium]